MSTSPQQNPAANLRRTRLGQAIRIALQAAALAPVLLSSNVLAADQDASSLEEVVVTAQFNQATNLQETPLAITALSADALSDRGIQNLIGVATAAPNVDLQLTGSAFGKSMSAFIRGVGQGDFNFAFEPGVGIYVDDVYHATVAGSVFDLLDLERVEVLRGPQGTLFGKNSIGGAIRLISRKPQGDGTGYISGTYGKYDRMDFNGAFDVALTDKLFMRISGMSKQREGYVERLDFVCANPDFGVSRGFSAPNLAAPRLIRNQRQRNGGCVIGTEGGEDVQGGRLALRWLPSDSFEVNFMADWLVDNSEAAATDLIAASPASTTTPGNPFNIVTFNTNVNVPTFGVPWDQRFLTASRYQNYSTFYDVTNDRTVPAVSTVDSYGGSLALDWDIAKAVHFKSITAYRGYSGDFSDDQDASPLNLAYAYNVVDHHQFSQEVQLTGTAFDGRLDWATGAFYFDSYSLNRGHINLQFFAPFPGAPPLDFDQNDPSTVKDKAAFLQGTFHVTDKLGVTLGGRYTDEEKEYTYNHVSLPFINLVNSNRSTSYGHTDWKAGVDYKWTADLMTYAQVSTGFKGGGFNPRPFNTNQVIPFGPEKLRSYEVGAKSEWLAGRVRLNLAAYLSKYTDFQLGSQTQDATGAPLTAPKNVGAADIQGFELELETRPIDNLLISAAVGLTDFEYKDLDAAIGCSYVPVGTPCNASGPSLNDVPGNLAKWRGNLGMQYAIEMGNGSSVTPRVDANFRTSTPGGTQNNLFADDGIPGYTLANARVTWASADNLWSVAGLVSNLTDKQYYVNKFDLRAFGEGMMSGQPGRPREWAVELRRNFK
jgi:iron complex outermembrane receptor protein